MYPPWFVHMRAVLEVLYFLSGVVLTVGVFVAIRQLRLTKAEMALRYKREAIVAALRQCEVLTAFLGGFQPRFVAIFQDKPAVVPGRWRPANLAFGETAFDFKGDAGRWLQGIAANQERLIKAIAVCNDLEVFALPFVKGAAAEDIAFTPAAAAFCEIVEKFLPLIVALRNGILMNGLTHQPIASGPWEGVLGLYAIWSQRLKKDTLLSRAGSLMAEAEKIEVRGLDPIGPGERGKGKH
jgi:hypothetical protein